VILQLIRRGWPVNLQMSRTLPGTPEVVWGLITDWERQDDWMLEASDFEVIGEQREGVGVTAEASIRIAGIGTRDRVRVTGWDPPKRLVIEHLGWVSGFAEMRLVPVAGATLLVWEEHFRPPLGIAGALGMTLFKPLMLRIFRRDLRILESLTRARAHA
jgi:carbon monoxide dehydrogenase subunit G